jgi:hypothetical protein
MHPPGVIACSNRCEKNQRRNAETFPAEVRSYHQHHKPILRCGRHFRSAMSTDIYRMERSWVLTPGKSLQAVRHPRDPRAL